MNMCLALLDAQCAEQAIADPARSLEELLAGPGYINSTYIGIGYGKVGASLAHDEIGDIV